MEVNNEYLDKEFLKPEKIVIYTKTVYEEKNDNSYDEEDSYEDDDIVEQQYEKIVMLDESNKKCHLYKGFNKFTKECYDLPLEKDGWNIINKEEIRYDNYISCICNPDAVLYDSNDNKQFPNNCVLYETIDNADIGFCVYISNDNKYVHIYGITNNVIPRCYVDAEDEYKLYTNFIKTYEPIEIFIGKSIITDMTEESGCYGDDYDGNSILLRIGTNEEYRYVYICGEIYEFTTTEKILKYVSNVGVNGIAYPYAESENNCYIMNTKLYTSLDNHPDRETIGEIIKKEEIEYKKYETIEIMKSMEKKIEACYDEIN